MPAADEHCTTNTRSAGLSRGNSNGASCTQCRTRGSYYNATSGGAGVSSRHYDIT
jgi:hypothetical protein